MSPLILKELHLFVALLLQPNSILHLSLSLIFLLVYPVFFSGNSRGQRSLKGCSSWVCKRVRHNCIHAHS